ncbi:hybrid sensor histidine kinase/response regulator [Alloalcanivorax marinus]|uniref:hybrid sensor histidine kinase/response regulator n=1 Tax=Alloalcanivorax marinus TaxID=1177169 RepID=UPI001933C863|nr:hybrid sensor histidine kinase/response regulator [Alloalcanivorax marinus]MBL7250354.1 response regulator [Alloalcanivorax marinus]
MKTGILRTRTTPRPPRRGEPRRAARLWLGAVLLLLAALGHAAPPPPYVISSLPERARITIYSEYLPDPGGTLTVDQVAGGDHEGAFQPAARFVERLGLSDHPWWIRVAVRNELGDQRRFALILGPRDYHDSTLFVPDGDRYRPASANERFQQHTPVYLVDLPAGETRVFYWRLNPRGGLLYSIRLGTLASALDGDAGFILYWALLGMMLTLAAYNILVATLRGGPSHGYHAGFLVAMAALLLFVSGDLADSPFWGPWLPQLKLVSIMAVILCACGVGRTFVDSRRYAPWLHRLLLVISALAVAGLVIGPWLSPVRGLTLAFGLALVAAVTMLILAYQTWHREAPLGGLYFFTSLVIASPLILACLTLFGITGGGLDLVLSVMVAVNLAAFIQAVGLRIQYLRRQRLIMAQRRDRAVAEAVDATRRETLARMGHDARTPLSGILGMAEILDDTPLTPNQKECVSGIRNAGGNLLKIINDVLEYSQLSDQGADLNREAMDTNDLLMDAVDLFRERAEEKQVELITHVHTNVPARLEGDPGRLRQVLTNLLGAFLRHAQPGELIIDISLEPTGRAGLVRFEFSGTALRPGTLTRLRDQDARRDSSGLNLSIAEQLVEAMDGRHGERDEPGDAGYWFVLPLPALEPAPDSADTDGSILQGRSMLVVDDSSTVTRVIRHLALSWGMRVTACHDPREALASLRTQANINEPYDVVLLDHLMPGMNGLQLAARIHEDPVITHPTALIMLTGVNNAPNGTEARNAGIHRVLAKPVSAPRLKQALAEELGLKHRSPQGRHPATPAPGLRLLVVEDHKLSQKVIRGMLNKLGLDPELAANGKEALEKACQRTYDLILMDCEMPEMDGFEATRRIRDHERQHGLPPVPIVALTAHILREHRERSLASGMNAHIPKPVEMSVLRDTLVRFTSGAPDAGRPTPDA